MCPTLRLNSTKYCLYLIEVSFDQKTKKNLLDTKILVTIVIKNCSSFFVTLICSHSCTVSLKTDLCLHTFFYLKTQLIDWKD